MKSSSRRRIQFFLIGCLTLLSVVLFLTGVEEQKLRLSGSASELDNSSLDGTFFSKEIPLARHQAERFSIRDLNFCIHQSKSETRQLVFATSMGRVSVDDLRIFHSKTRIELVQSGEVIYSLIPNGRAECNVSVVFSDGSIHVFTSSGTESIEIKRPIVFAAVLFSETLMDINNDPAWSVESFSNGTEVSTQRALLVVIIGVISLLILLTTFRRSTEMNKLPGFLFGPRLLVFSVITSWMVCAPFFLDDGWVFQSSRNMKYSLNVFALYQSWDVRLPIGWLQYLISGPLSTLSSDILIVRLIPVTCICIMWVILERLVRKFDRTSPFEQYLLAIIFLSAAVSWLMTLRPEPIIALLTSINLVIGLRILEKPCFDQFLQGIFVGVISLTVHSVGVVALIPIIASCVVLLFDRKLILNSKLYFLRYLLALGAFGTSLLTSILFANRDFADWQQNSELFRSAIGQTTWRDETGRYLSLFNGGMGDTVVRRSIIILVVASLLLPLLPKRPLVQSERYISFSLYGCLIVMLLSPTKWPWHFGSITPILILSSVIFFSNVREFLSRNESMGRIGWLLLISLIAFAIFVVWNSSDNWEPLGRMGSANGLENWIKDFMRSPNLLGVFLAFIVAMGYWLFRFQGWTRFASFLLLSLLFSSTLFSVVTISLANFTTNGWSIGKQSLNIFTDQFSCGQADELIIPNVWDSNKLVMLESNLDQTFKPEVRQNHKLRVFQAVDSKGDVSMSIRNPHTDYLLVFVATENSDNDVIYVRSSNKPVTAIPDIAGGPRFVPVLIELEVTSESNTIYLDTAGAKDGLMLTEPLGVEAIQLSDLLNQRDFTAQIDPFISMAFPCVKSTSFHDGVVEVPDLVMGFFPLATTSPLWIARDSVDFYPLTVSSGQRAFEINLVIP